MISGLGFTEIIVIGLIIIMFFGSEDLPKLLRMVGEQWGKIRRFTNAARAEIDTVVKDVTPDLKNEQESSIQIKKQDIRKYIKNKISKMSENDLEKESAEITEKLTTLDQWKNSASIMLFVSLKDEPNTSSLIKKALAGGKRVIVPYCKDKSGAMGISEIKDPLKDLVEGNYGIQEPKKELRDNFFTSDIRLIICPGVAFGKDLSRLGRGKGYYDRFLKNLSGKIPTIGLGYSCQLKEEPIPFDYHDVMMDTIVTPNDIIIRNNS